MKRFVLTREAEQNLDDIWLYIARESRSIAPAEKLIRRICDVIILLAANPAIGRPCSDDIDPQGYWFPVGRYIVYYRRLARRIAITHIFDGSRDQKTAWRQGRL